MDRVHILQRTAKTQVMSVVQIAGDKRNMLLKLTTPTEAGMGSSASAPVVPGGAIPVCRDWPNRDVYRFVSTISTTPTNGKKKKGRGKLKHKKIMNKSVVDLLQQKGLGR